MSTAAQKHKLDIPKVIEDFNRAEKEDKRRSGTFKIDAPFSRALDAILKSKAETKPSRKRRRKT